MRTFGTMLILLALACLVVGVFTLVMTINSSINLGTKFQNVRQVVEKNIDEAKVVLEDVEGVFQDSRAIVGKYKTGSSEEIDHNEVRDVFDRISGILKKTEDVRESAKEGILEVESFKDEIIIEGGDLAGVAGTSVVTLILSGWLLAFGIWAKSVARRREQEVFR